MCMTARVTGKAAYGPFCVPTRYRNRSTSMPLPDVFYWTAPVTMTVTFGPKGQVGCGTDGMRRPSPPLWREHSGKVDFFD